MTSSRAALGSGELISSMHFEDFEVSWAGAGPKDNMLCFGSEDGRLLFSDPRGENPTKAQKANRSGEAVNGVAFIDRWLAISTRSEIGVFTLPLTPGEKTYIAEIPLGAHDVVSGVGGYFIAPLGHRGILFCQPAAGPEQKVTVSCGKERIYFYRVATFQSSGANDIITCAVRRDGVATMRFQGDDEKHSFSTCTFDELDVIDVCPLSANGLPRSAAALGRDGIILLYRDVLNDDKPVAVRYEIVQGVAYRLLSARGNLILLTSRGLYVITELLDNVLAGGVKRSTTPVLALPMKASDANLVADRWVLVIADDEVLRLDLDLLGDSKPVSVVAVTQTPVWKRRHLFQHHECLGSGRVAYQSSASPQETHNGPISGIQP